MTDKQPGALLPPDIFGCGPAVVQVDAATTQQLVQALRIQRAELETLRARFAESDMTGKQLEALELASLADTADLAGYPTAKKANAYCLCLLEDCAQMIRRLHAENEALRAGYAAARLEIESLREEHIERDWKD